MGRTAIPVESKNCPQCGGHMSRRRFSGRLEDRTAFLRRVYCSRKCMALSMQKEVCASKSHSRKKAARLARAECEVCGATGLLHVHHRDENPSNNILSNLQTLCPSCHQKSHSPNYTGEALLRVSCVHCEAPSYRQGLCHMHLSRMKRHGHPLAKKIKIGSSWILQIGS